MKLISILIIMVLTTINEVYSIDYSKIMSNTNDPTIFSIKLNNADMTHESTKNTTSNTCTYLSVGDDNDQLIKSLFIRKRSSGAGYIADVYKNAQCSTRLNGFELTKAFVCNGNWIKMNDFVSLMCTLDTQSSNIPSTTTTSTTTPSITTTPSTTPTTQPTTESETPIMVKSESPATPTPTETSPPLTPVPTSKPETSAPVTQTPTETSSPSPSPTETNSVLPTPTEPTTQQPQPQHDSSIEVISGNDRSLESETSSIHSKSMSSSSRSNSNESKQPNTQTTQVTESSSSTSFSVNGSDSDVITTSTPKTSTPTKPTNNTEGPFINDNQSTTPKSTHTPSLSSSLSPSPTNQFIHQSSSNELFDMDNKNNSSSLQCITINITFYIMVLFSLYLF